MKGLAWYLGIAFLPAWIMWEAAIRSGVDPLSWRMQLFLVPGAFCPALATFVVRKWVTREGFGDLKLSLRSGRWALYLAAWLLPLLVVAMMCGEAVAVGLGTPDFTLATAVAAESKERGIDAVQGMGLLIIPQTMFAALIFTPVLFGEEFGWRGYLQRRLYPKRPVASAMATGVIWGVWHWPLTLRGYNYPDHPLLGSALLVVLAVLMSYILDWFYRRSGSIWCNSLAHSATNAMGGTLTRLWFAGMGTPFFVSYAGLLAIPPLAIVCVIIALIDKGSLKNTPRLSVKQTFV